jgi:two-component system nitrate/nitrite sensor histidine kinase NarX
MADGTVRWLHDRAFPIRDEQGKADQLLRITQDVTSRLLTQQSLERLVDERTEEIERRRQVAEGLRDIMAVLNSNQPLIDVLDYIVVQASRVLRADAAALYRLDPRDNILKIQSSTGLSDEYTANADVPLGQAVTGRAAKARLPVTLSDTNDESTTTQYFLDAQRRDLLNRLSSEYRSVLSVPLVVKEQTYGAITLYYRAPRKVPEEEIRLAVAFSDQAALALENARLRDQIQQVAVAAERSRLARDLHDSVTQTLFSASLIAEVLPSVWQRNQKEGVRALEEMRLLSRSALAEMRSLLLELRPAALLEMELDDLFRQLTEAMAGRAQIPIDLQMDDDFSLHSDVRVALYRVAQEALNNVVKHASASQAVVTLKELSPDNCEGVRADTESCIELTIWDNGSGFDPERVPPDSLGLSIMRERTQAIDATLNIQSRPGGGTTVSVLWQKPVEGR